MKIAIIGTGYVGLPSGVGFAELGNEVVCIDKMESKIEALNKGVITLYEEGLEELFHKNVKAMRLKFSTKMSDIEGAKIVILAVGTPPHPQTKEADMRYIFAAAEELAEYLQDYVVVANKSTVPVGIGKEVKQIIAKANPKADFDVVSLPEFLREGFAVYDFFNPDRIIVGCDSPRAKEVISELYAPFKDKSTLLFTSLASSETIKYASNAFLSIKIHYINEIANFCEKVGADVQEVAKGMGLDKRIGNRFLNAGAGYGGSCFPKDTLALSLMAEKQGVSLELVKTAIKGNDERKKQMAQRITQAVKGIEKPTIAALGLAFKDGTDDCRESPAITIIQELLKENFTIKAYDPKAMNVAKEILGRSIEYANSAQEAIQQADVIAILTEWQEFASLNLEELGKTMKHKIIVDCRNLIDKDLATKLGFVYVGVGR